jgi:hypothetical protein
VTSNSKMWCLRAGCLSCHPACASLLWAGNLAQARGAGNGGIRVRVLSPLPTFTLVVVNISGVFHASQ